MHTKILTCIQCDVRSADRSGSGGSGRATARWRSRTRDTCVVWNLDGCVDATLRCSCWTGASEENTLCRTRKKQVKKISIFPVMSFLEKKSAKTYGDLSCFKLLEMLCHLLLAAELDLTLGTFIFLFAGQYFPWFGIWGCLA